MCEAPQGLELLLYAGDVRGAVAISYPTPRSALCCQFSLARITGLMGFAHNACALYAITMRRVAIKC